MASPFDRKCFFSLSLNPSLLTREKIEKILPQIVFIHHTTRETTIETSTPPHLESQKVAMTTIGSVGRYEVHVKEFSPTSVPQRKLMAHVEEATVLLFSDMI